MGVSRGCPNFLGTPIIAGTGKLRTSNFVGTLIGSIGTKPMKSFGNSSRGCSQGVPNFFRAPTCIVRSHLCDSTAFSSHEVPHWLYMSKFTRLRAVSRRQHGSCIDWLCNCQYICLIWPVCTMHYAHDRRHTLCLLITLYSYVTLHVLCYILKTFIIWLVQLVAIL